MLNYKQISTEESQQNGWLISTLQACYLVFAFFFPTLLAFILLLCYIKYGLEYLYCLFARIYSIPHLV